MVEVPPDPHLSVYRQDHYIKNHYQDWHIKINFQQITNIEKYQDFIVNMHLNVVATCLSLKY